MMIYYWVQEATQTGAAQQGASSWPSAILSGGVVGAVVGLVGVLIGQYLTQRRHSQTLRQTAELETQRAREAALQKYFEQMREALADPDRPLRRSTIGDDLSVVAHAHRAIVCFFRAASHTPREEGPGCAVGSTSGVQRRCFAQRTDQRLLETCAYREALYRVIRAGEEPLSSRREPLEGLSPLMKTLKTSPIS